MKYMNTHTAQVIALSIRASLLTLWGGAGLASLFNYFIAS